jgi:hypothetical protein
MISFTDREIEVIAEKARPISVERRSVYLQRVISMMQFRARSIADLTEVCDLATTGLTTQSDGSIGLLEAPIPGGIKTLGFGDRGSPRDPDPGDPLWRDPGTGKTNQRPPARPGKGFWASP